jgi:hypothetical protein
VDTAVDVVEVVEEMVVVDLVVVDKVVDLDVVDEVVDLVEVVLLELVAAKVLVTRIYRFLRRGRCTWQALTIPIILILACIRRYTGSRASPAFPSTLTPFSHLGRGQPSKQQDH